MSDAISVQRSAATTPSDLNLPNIPGPLRALMAEVGPKWRDDTRGHVDLMIAEFSEVLKLTSRDGVTVHRDIPYGPHERQHLDVFLPTGNVMAPPVVLFVHGGAFVSGHRNRSEQIYSNVLCYLAQRGIAAVNVGYRLATHAAYPGATLDIAAAVDWARAHAHEYGWNPDRVFLMSHSAGAAHAGSYAYDPAFSSAGRPPLAGMIVVSGRVRIDNLAENPNAKRVEQYYGTDASRFEGYSPVHHINRDSVATFVAWAEFENPLIDVYCAELVFRLAEAKRKSPPMMWLPGHNHTSAIAHIGTSDDLLGKAIVNFVTNPR
ncbi:alpha/beta hydrolase [Bradyrhizobium ottawaense]|uniref:Alpha/beta hydrolase fold n=3 Tax=Bradyrhizobium TaxID=374 RepID=A0ABY0Q061_9BRAD|nr:alpha/beta hydrolase [Bradyrhizobium ottawaense]SDJ27598.1 alpha/beta hydrolase fold [Bradyrhizobium ottawaense]SEC74194.1 alpha/beta hydrolase fold [Bradyrhizobium lablabi]